MKSWQEEVKKTEPDPSQWQPLNGKRDNGQKLKYKKFCFCITEKLDWNREVAESPSLKEIQNSLALSKLLTEQPAALNSALKRELDRTIFRSPFQNQLVCDSVKCTRQAKKSFMSYTQNA